MMKLRISTSGNYSNQLEGKPNAENAVVLNTLFKDTSEEDIVLLVMKTILVVVKWNKVCLSHESQEHRRSENISPGELAGVYFTIAEVSRRVLRPVNKVKLPHVS